MTTTAIAHTGYKIFVCPNCSKNRRRFNKSYQSNICLPCESRLLRRLLKLSVYQWTINWTDTMAAELASIENLLKGDN